jgi:hypothetical protein
VKWKQLGETRETQKRNRVAPGGPGHTTRNERRA